MNASRSCSSERIGPHANLPSTMTTIRKMPSVQIALPRLPANGLSAAPSSAAWIGSVVSARTATINSFFMESRFTSSLRLDPYAGGPTGPPPHSGDLRFQNRHHADDDGEQRRAFDHRRGDAPRRPDPSGHR